MKWTWADFWASLTGKKQKDSAKQPRARHTLHFTAPSATTIGIVVAFLLFAGIAIWIIVAVVRFFGQFYSQVAG